MKTVYVDAYNDNAKFKTILDAVKFLDNVTKVDGGMMKQAVKEYCKLHKLKFEGNVPTGFIASRLVEVRAGMEYTLGLGKFISIPIKIIGKKRVFNNFLCYADGDIVDNGKIKI